jgi:hypothetical protein
MQGRSGEVDPEDVGIVHDNIAAGHERTQIDDIHAHRLIRAAVDRLSNAPDIDNFIVGVIGSTCCGGPSRLYETFGSHSS